MYMQQESQYCTVSAGTTSICHIEAQTDMDTLVFRAGLNTKRTSYVPVIQAKIGCFSQKTKSVGKKKNI